jgi:plasmid stabilization system protein ParE
MGQVIWSPSVLNDKDAMAEYIAKDSINGAALLVSRIVETTDQLQKFSLSGRLIPETNGKSGKNHPDSVMPLKSPSGAGLHYQ